MIDEMVTGALSWARLPKARRENVLMLFREEIRDLEERTVRTERRDAAADFAASIEEMRAAMEILEAAGRCHKSVLEAGREIAARHSSALAQLAERESQG